MAFPPSPGEDSLFSGRNDYVYALGVADGVTDWAERGFKSSAELAQTLMRKCHSAVKQEMLRIRKPRELMQHAYTYMKQCCGNTQTALPGTTTICVATVEKYAPHLLHVANLGDSGFMLLRKVEHPRSRFIPALQSAEQMHGPDFPYQLGCSSRDSPDDAEDYSTQLHPGDVLMLATDGVYDNLFYDTICEVTHNGLMSGGIWKACEQIVDTAYQYAIGSDPTPTRHRGGRLDDMTVVMAQVVKDS